MNLYLNLDLLYNVNQFLFPLFYYSANRIRVIYSPMTLKSVCIEEKDVVRFFDYITQKIKMNNHTGPLEVKMEFTEETLEWSGIFFLEDVTLNRTEPFKFKKESFLKSKINLN